jgi:hypothetical protein
LASPTFATPVVYVLRPKLIIRVVITMPVPRVVEILRPSRMTFEFLRCRRERWFLRLQLLFLLMSSRFAVVRVVFQPGHVSLRQDNLFA